MHIYKIYIHKCAYIYIIITRPFFCQLFLLYYSPSRKPDHPPEAQKVLKPPLFGPFWPRNLSAIFFVNFGGSLASRKPDHPPEAKKVLKPPRFGPFWPRNLSAIFLPGFDPRRGDLFLLYYYSFIITPLLILLYYSFLLLYYSSITTPMYIYICKNRSMHIYMIHIYA